MNESKELLIGVIGAGGRGELADEAHKPERGVRLVAGADIDPKAIERFQAKYGKDVFVTSDYRELLQRCEIGAVFVTTRDHLHEEHAVAALEAGKHVYLEKPMAITIAGCDRILRTAYERKLKLYLGHNMRHMSFVLKMKELIQDGAIGEVKTGWCRHFVCYGGDAYFKDWHAERSKATSLLLQKAAHDIDVLHWLCGGHSVRVHAMGGLVLYGQITDRHSPMERGDASWSLDNWPPLSQKGLNPIIDVEDLSLLQARLNNGVFISYQQCHFAPDGWRNYTIIGTEGRVENFGDEPGACVVRLWNKKHYYHPSGDADFPMPAVSGGHGGADPRIVEEFVRYVREGGTITTSAIAARDSVATGCQAAESLRSGGIPLDIPPVAPEIKAYFEADVR
ncbi:MAG: Gfo/Idh/MocA family oxidoreductase [Verrucomicrobiae bacterium]|nr:Gfo/Idh/MocA family oxidoreductase [Verrucomicrobiae bacterium]